MHEKVKRIITAIGTFLAGLLAGIAGVVLHNRRTAEPARKLAEAAGSRIDDAISSVREAAATGNDIASTAGNIDGAAESIRSCIDNLQERNNTTAGILGQIRQQKLTDNSGM